MINEDVNDSNRLKELGGSGYEVKEGQPNIKGWDVRDEQGTLLGTVDELLFCTKSLKVRYVVVSTEYGDGDDERRVLIPIGVAELHSEHDEVLVPGINPQRLTELPRYDKGSITPEDEYRVRGVFDGQPGTYNQVTYDCDGFYDHEHFNDERFYGARRDTGDSTDRTTVSGGSGTLPWTTDAETGDAFGNSEEGIATGTDISDEGKEAISGDRVNDPAELAENEPNYTGEPDRTANDLGDYPGKDDPNYGRMPG